MRGMVMRPAQKDAVAQNDEISVKSQDLVRADQSAQDGETCVSTEKKQRAFSTRVVQYF